MTATAELADFAGHPRRPMDWDRITGKFHAIAGERYDRDHRERIVETVRRLDHHDVSDLVALLD